MDDTARCRSFRCGKSLIFTLPVLKHDLRAPGASVVYRTVKSGQSTPRSRKKRLRQPLEAVLGSAGKSGGPSAIWVGISGLGALDDFLPLILFLRKRRIVLSGKRGNQWRTHNAKRPMWELSFRRQTYTNGGLKPKSRQEKHR
jgi:hypothetical protein